MHGLAPNPGLARVPSSGAYGARTSLLNWPWGPGSLCAAANQGRLTCKKSALDGHHLHKLPVVPALSLVDTAVVCCVWGLCNLVLFSSQADAGRDPRRLQRSTLTRLGRRHGVTIHPVPPPLFLPLTLRNPPDRSGTKHEL